MSHFYFYHSMGKLIDDKLWQFWYFFQKIGFLNFHANQIVFLGNIYTVDTRYLKLANLE